MSLGNVYLASGWFSPEWLEEVENIKSVFEKHGITWTSKWAYGGIVPDGALLQVYRPDIGLDRCACHVERGPNRGATAAVPSPFPACLFCLSYPN